MLIGQGLKTGRALWIHCMLVISICFYAYRARPDVGRGSMTIWYAIVFVTIACSSKVICLYGHENAFILIVFEINE